MRDALSAERRIPPRLFLYGLLTLFLLSGLAGLIYQSIWSHYLGLLLGHAAYAQALVLATFMGGMAAGAALVAHYGGRWRNLVRGYAVVELALGVAGVAFHWLFIGAHGLVLDVLLPFAPAGASGLLKWSVGIGLILPQTLLLGASFPLLSAGILRRVQAGDGRVLGNLYFTNSIGAAIGALVATFVLLPLAGLPGAVQFAGWLNLMIGLAAWMLGSDPAAEGVLPRRPRAEPAPDTRISVDAAGGRYRLLVLLLAATALSSAASFVYEIGWVRMLGLAVGTTLHAFELMLAAFIGGLALGGLWVRGRADRFRRPLLALGWIQFAMGVCALGSLALYTLGAFEWVRFLMDALAPTDTGYAFYNLGIAAAALALMLPAAFFAGATLPLFTTILLQAGHGESVIGRVYACNTLGAIIGVLAAVHLLIPVLGLRDAMIVAAVVDLAIGIALLRLQPGIHVRRPRIAVASVLGLAVVAMAVAWIQFDPQRLASGVYRSGQATLAPGTEMRYYRDGKTASVALYESQGGLRSITYNGKVDAAISYHEEAGPASDEPTMVLAAALPLALHADPRSVAVIGLGSGLTTHALLADPRPRDVETIEIEARMVEAARGFGERVERAWTDPRSRIVIDDAMTVLSGDPRSRDIIISEPSNPWMAGVGALFADEFYRFVGRRLTDDGLFVQWLQLYEIDEALVGSVLSALVPHFGDYRAWMSNNADLLIVATPGDRLPELDPERMFAGAPGEELARAGLHDPAQLRLREFADGPLLRALARTLGEQPNSWYRPRLMIDAPRTRFRDTNADTLIRLGTSRSLPLELLGTGAPLPAAVEPAGHGHHAAERTTLHARAVRDLLLGREPEGVNPASGVARDAALVRHWATDCDALAGTTRQMLWLELLGRFARQYLPLLDSDHARDLFIEPAWFGCDDPPVTVAAALDLVSALAARDHARIPAAADHYLALARQPALVSGALNELAFLSAQAALVARGEPQAAERFRFRHLGAVELDAQARLLHALIEQYGFEAAAVP